MRYRWQLLDAGPIALDGGGMFGVVPRVIWQKFAPPDERGRVHLTHNCLLLTPEDGGKPLVIETGTGDKSDPKTRDIFGLLDRSIETAVVEAGVDPADVADVIVSHLHFDHAGGLTRLLREGETPDWRDRDGKEVRLTFPNATIHTQRREWNDALANSSVMTRTYLAEHLQPIRERINLIDSPPPFPPGVTPTRGERPGLPVEERMTQVRPGVFAFCVPGHTWGQQAVLFKDTGDRRVCFVPDVMPTVNHVGPAYSLAYDVEPYTSMITRRWLLGDAAANDWLLVLDHEPRTPLARVREDGKGWYRLEPEPA